MRKPLLRRLWRSEREVRAAVHTAARAFRAYGAPVLLVLALLGEVVLVLVAMYLIDLSVSLMELWAELARKHLELTL